MKLKLLLIGLFVCLASIPCFSQEADSPNEYFPNGDLKILWEPNEGTSLLTRKEFYENGRLKSQANLINNKLTGIYVEYYEDGKLYLETTYKDDALNGPFREYFSNGTVKSEGEYIDGKLNGIQYIYYKDGKLSQEANYDNDILHGVVKIYFPNGQIRQLSTYRSGKLSGPFKIYGELGTLLSDRNYVDDLQQGPFNSYQDSGVLSESGTFKDDKVVVLKNYTPDGILLREINFQDGLKHGDYREYYNSGVLKIYNTYDNDILVSQQAYDQYGLSISYTDTQPSGQINFLSSFSKKEIFFILGILLLSIFGTTLVVNGYHRMVRPKTFMAQDVYPEVKQEKTHDKDHNPNVIDPNADKMYRSLVETVRSGIYLTDAKGKLIYGNNTFSQLLGFRTKPETAGMNLDDTFSDFERNKKKFLEQLNESKAVYDYTFKYKKSDGTIAILSTSANHVFNDRGQIIGVQGVIMDITEKFHLEETVRTEKKKLELLLDFFETIDTIREMDALTKFIINGISEILESNRCSLMMAENDSTSLKVCEAKGMDKDVMASTKVDWGEPIAGKVAKEGKPILIKNIEYDDHYKEFKKPSYRGRSLMAAPLIYNENLVGVICVTDKKDEILYGEPFNNIDLKILITIASKVVIALENVKMYNDLNLLSHTDPITQIYNYRLFSQSLDREISRFKREKNDLAIFMMDLDSFKSYNDTYGHIEGDELLKNLGKILKENLRESDIVCRYAGDEFCVVLPNTNIEGAQKAAEKVVKGVREFPHFKRVVTISIGIAPYIDGLDKKEFIKHADAALYDAKHSGKNTVKVYQPEAS
ncbi:MAG: diguanylate cyclase [Candidatus Omnitrophota bacterium]